MSSLKWIFDGVAASGKTSGGDAFVERLSASPLKRGELFAREAISNSADQKPDNSTAPVKIYLDVIELSGETKEKFKDAIDWDTLSKHAGAAATKPNIDEAHSRIHGSIRDFNDHRQSITLVRISDYGANGLVGDEDDENKNFFLFAKAILESSDDKNTQGSFGLGKGVLYHLSNLRTVLMSSSISIDNKLVDRVFGRSELPSHKLDEKGTEDWNPKQKWDGSGFFGASDKRDTPRSESVFGISDALQKDLFLNRDQSLGTGTTAISLGFNTPYGDASSTVEGLAAHIRKWFWPALSQQDPDVEIYVREFKNHDCVTAGDGRIKINETYQPFADALNNSQNSSNAHELDALITSEMKTDITPKDSNAFNVVGEVKILHSKTENSNANRIALLRNKLCVVRYENITKPDEIQHNLYAVYLAGFARPIITPEDDSFHQFLRLAEPALHDDWLEITRVKMLYDLKPTAKKFLKDHKSRIIAKVRTMLSDDSAPIRVNHDHLSAKFNFGRKGKREKVKKVGFEFSNQSINKNLFELSLTISCLVPTDLSWLPSCTLMIRGHGGTKDNLLIKDVIFKDSDHVSKISSILDGNVCRFNVDPSLEQFEVKLIAEIPKNLLQKNSLGVSINPRDLTYSADVTSRERS